MRIVMLGPPASGKGTQGIRLAAQFGVPHVSSGDLLRESMERDDPLGIRPIVARGELVPDELVEQVLLPALGDRFVLDGYPRTATQAARLDAELDRRELSVEAAVEIAVPKEVLAQRMEHRARVENRPDDRPEAFARRIQEYLAEAPLLRDHYKDRLIVVDGDGRPDEVYEWLLSALSDEGLTPQRSRGV